MKRRGFLKLLGFAPAAPFVAKALAKQEPAPQLVELEEPEYEEFADEDSSSLLVSVNSYECAMSCIPYVSTNFPSALNVTNASSQKRKSRRRK